MSVIQDQDERKKKCAALCEALSKTIQIYGKGLHVRDVSFCLMDTCERLRECSQQITEAAAVIEHYGLDRYGKCHEKEEAHAATCAGDANSTDQNCAASDTSRTAETLKKKENQPLSQTEEPGGKAFLHLHEDPADVQTESQTRIHTLPDSNRKK